MNSIVKALFTRKFKIIILFEQLEIFILDLQMDYCSINQKKAEEIEAK
jgi:hypothetical protein